MSLRNRFVALSTLALATALPASAQLIGADEVLRRLEKSITGSQLQAASKPAEFLADIRRFRAEAPAMEPAKAAAAWLALFDRAASLGQPTADPDSRVMDTEINATVGTHSVLAALPAPEAWPALREAARSRAKAKADTRSLGLRLLTDLLANDRKAAEATLVEIERAAGALAPGERESMRAQAGYLRAELARLYGSREEVAATFVASLEGQRSSRYDGTPVPDLVGLVGEARAAAILRDALVRPVALSVPEGDATRALAKRVALEQIANLRVAQWGLVDGIDTAALYEAMEKRFVGKRADGPRGEERFEPNRREADTYYFLALVVAGRHADAERMLRAIVGDAPLHLPKPAVDALERAGKNEALYAFLHALLERHPDLRAGP